MKPGDRAAFVLATWFGCGLSRVAPGTVGSLGALPLHFLLLRAAPGAHGLALLAITAVGVWAAHRVSVVLSEEDPQRVVIDEVAGVLIALAFVRGSGLPAEVAAFALFRLLDITKPGVIHRVEHAKPAGLGIMADDLVAGLAAGVLARAAVMAAAAL